MNVVRQHIRWAYARNVVDLCAQQLGVHSLVVDWSAQIGLFADRPRRFQAGLVSRLLKKISALHPLR